MEGSAWRTTGPGRWEGQEDSDEALKKCGTGMAGWKVKLEERRKKGVRGRREKLQGGTESVGSVG